MQQIFKEYTMSKRKNILEKTPNGRIIRTRDKDLQGGNDYEKEGSKGLYRGAVVVDSNSDDELAIVKLTTSSKGIPLPEYRNGKSKYRKYILTLDKNNNPIKITPAENKGTSKPRFEADKPKNDMPKKLVNKIKKDCIEDKINGKENRKRLHKLKKRK